MTHPFLSRRSTPVFYAVLHGCEESLALLLEAQADPSLRTWDRVRYSPLEWAVLLDRKCCARRLFDFHFGKGADFGFGRCPPPSEGGGGYSIPAADRRLFDFENFTQRRLFYKCTDWDSTLAYNYDRVFGDDGWGEDPPSTRWGDPGMPEWLVSSDTYMHIMCLIHDPSDDPWARPDTSW